MAVPFEPSRLVNPIWLKSVRSRLRLRHMVSWGTVVVTVMAFMFMGIYMNMTEQGNTTSETAAKAVIPGIVIIQSVILMMFGTGAVASGISQERDERLVDYQRMTPMSPTSKIIGYMFGLPAREYFLFALTLPFLAVAVWMSKFSLLTLGHFYLVFFTSVWVYHMTGLVAGMILNRPRFASMLSMGFVFALYFALPNLSRFGITYFEFLTIRPTFFGLLQQELPDAARHASPTLASIDTFRDVPFFDMFLHPTVYTMLVQGFLLSVMFVVVHRKWKNQTNHSLSKASALVVYFGVLMFLLASVWALVTNDEVRRQVFEPLNRGPAMHSLYTLMTLVMIEISLCGAAFFMVMMSVTPSRIRAIEGLRRARKHGRTRVHFNDDGASSFPLATALVALTGAALAITLYKAGASDMFFERKPTFSSVAALFAISAFIGFFIHGFRERCGILVFLVATFVLWVVPLFVMTIVMSAKHEWVLGAFVGLPCPLVSVWMAAGTMLDSTMADGGTLELFAPEQYEWRHEIVRTSLAFHGVLAIGVQLELWRWKRKMRAAIMAKPAAEVEETQAVPLPA